MVKSRNNLPIKLASGLFGSLMLVSLSAHADIATDVATTGWAT